MRTQTTPTLKVSRADVLRLTWQLVRNASLSFSAALKQAWATVRLKVQMLTGPTEFTYVKEDGTKRVAIGHYIPAPASSGNSKPTSPLAICYYDTIADGWRSFRADRLVIA